MPSTHTSLHVHVTFSTKGRYPLIDREWRDRLHAYVGGTLRGLESTALNVGGTADHLHILCGTRPTVAVAHLVREIKKASTHWIRESYDGRFSWQEGYGAFTVSRWDLEKIGLYVASQEEHHRAHTFEDEYRMLLVEHGIEFDERYLW